MITLLDDIALVRAWFKRYGTEEYVKINYSEKTTELNFEATYTYTEPTTFHISNTLEESLKRLNMNIVQIPEYNFGLIKVCMMLNSKIKVDKNWQPHLYIKKPHLLERLSKWLW